MSANLLGNLPFSYNQHKSAPAPHVVVSEGIKACYDAGDFTDLTLVCKGNGRKFKCHKVIVCSQSKVFRTACTNGMVETATSRIELEESSDLINLMLEFLYSQSYALSICEEHGPDKIGPLNTHLQLHILADKYDIPTLRRFAAAQLTKYLESRTRFDELVDCIPAVYQILQPEASKTRRLLLQLLQLHGKKIPASRKRSLIDGSESIETGHEKLKFMESVLEIPELLEDVLEVFVGG
ncbi:MAG: hypothetical protein Q9183_004651 [Haloplaca sp. 2 TL-2023]